MTFRTSTRIASLALALAALAGCPQGEGTFDFQDTYRGALSDQTYAVGSNMDIIVYGPQGFDMGTTVARTVGDDSAVRLERTEPFPEFNCIVATGTAEVPGDGEIAVADKLTRRPLETVEVATDTVDGIALGRGLNRWNGTLQGEGLGGEVSVLTGGSLAFGAAPTNAEGEVLAGGLPMTASYDAGEVDVWDGSLQIWDPADGIIDLSLGDLSRSLTVKTVAAADIVELEVTVREIGARGDMNELSGERLLLVSGVTADGTRVLGVEADWTVDGWEYGTGDTMWSYENDGGSVCWNELCATF